MSCTIKAKIFVFDNETKIINMFKKIGFDYDDSYLLKNIFTIQLKENISILDSLQDFGYFKKIRSGKYDLEEIWEIRDFNEYGISLYIAHPNAGDGVVFINKENIVSIHDFRINKLMQIKEYADSKM